MPIKTRSQAPDLGDLLKVKRTLTDTMKRKKISVASLARELGTGRTAVRRALDEKNTATTFKTIQRTAKVLGFAVKLEARPLSPVELGTLARRMIGAKTPDEGNRLERQLVDGFFGDAQSQT
jgi:DNA-binding phage protein